MKHSDEALNTLQANLMIGLRGESDVYNDKRQLSHELYPNDAVELLGHMGFVDLFEPSKIRYAGRNYSEGSRILVVITDRWYFEFHQDAVSPWTITTLRLPLILTKEVYESLGKGVGGVKPWPTDLGTCQMVSAMDTYRWVAGNGCIGDVLDNRFVLLELGGERRERVSTLTISIWMHLYKTEF